MAVVEILTIIYVVKLCIISIGCVLRNNVIYEGKKCDKNKGEHPPKG